MDQRPAHPPLLDRAYNYGSSFAGTGSEVKQARDFIDKILTGYACCDEAVLLGSEAATNAIQHTESAHGAFDVFLWLGNDDSVLVAVRDQGGSTVPTARPLTTTEETGRGVVLFNGLAADADSFLRRWGFRRVGQHTTVWFELMRSSTTASHDA